MNLNLEIWEWEIMYNLDYTSLLHSQIVRGGALNPEEEPSKRLISGGEPRDGRKIS